MGFSVLKSMGLNTKRATIRTTKRKNDHFKVLDLLHHFLSSLASGFLLNPQSMSHTLASFKEVVWRRKWQPTPVFLPGKSHQQRSMAGYIQSMGSQRVRYDLATKQQQQRWLSDYTGLLASPGQDPVPHPHPHPHPMPVLGQAHVRFAINNSTNSNKPAVS